MSQLEFLKKLRARLGYTQAQMGERMGLSLRAYIDIEKGDDQWRTLHRLALERLLLSEAAARGMPDLAPPSVLQEARALALAPAPSVGKVPPGARVLPGDNLFPWFSDFKTAFAVVGDELRADGIATVTDEAITEWSGRILVQSLGQPGNGFTATYRRFSNDELFIKWPMMTGELLYSSNNAATHASSHLREQVRKIIVPVSLHQGS